MGKHTPGPWHYSKDASMHDTALVYAQDGWLVADAGRIHKRTPEEIEANATLLAAAWDLLAACKGAVAALSQNKTFPADIDAAKGYLADAIAKAEGDPNEG